MSSLREQAKSSFEIFQLWNEEVDKRLWVPVKFFELKETEWKNAETWYKNKIEELKRALRVSVESNNEDLEKLVDLEGKFEAIRKTLLGEAFREKLAELEHEQWVQWSKALVANEQLSNGRRIRWAKQWVPYSELLEGDKDFACSRALAIVELLRGVVSEAQKM